MESQFTHVHDTPPPGAAALLVNVFTTAPAESSTSIFISPAGAAGRKYSNVGPTTFAPVTPVPGTPEGWTSPDRDAAPGLVTATPTRARRPRQVTDSRR